MKAIIKILFLSYFQLTVFAQTTILAEDFEGETFPPEGWLSFIGENGIDSNANWSIAFAPNSRVAFSRYSDQGVGLAEDWLVTTRIDLTNSVDSELEFYSSETYGLQWTSQYDIRVSTSLQNNHSDFVTIATFNQFPFGTNSYEQNTVDLSAFDGQKIYIAFVHVDEYQDNWILDDITVRGTITDCDINQLEHNGGIVNANGNLQIGQSFVVDCDSRFDYFEYKKGNGSIPSAPITLYEGNSFNGTQIYTQIYEGTDSNSGLVHRIDILNEVNLTAGVTYTFRFEAGNTTILTDTSNSYANGTRVGINGPIENSDLAFFVGTTNLSLSINSTDSKSLKVFPNPASGYLSISNLKTKKNYTILNALGEKISSGYLIPNSNIMIEDLGQGIYFLKLDDYKAMRFIKN